MNESDGVIIYSMGLVYLSACAPVALSDEEATVLVNEASPSGIDSPWQVSDDKTFASGAPNPCPCDKFPAERRHLLFNC